jgi:hypothetical protein
MLITFPLRQWLRERASVLRHTYVASPLFLLRGETFLPRTFWGLFYQRMITLNISGMIIERIAQKNVSQRHFVHHKSHMNRSGINYVVTDCHIPVVLRKVTDHFTAVGEFVFRLYTFKTVNTTL